MQRTWDTGLLHPELVSAVSPAVTATTHLRVTLSCGPPTGALSLFELDCLWAPFSFPPLLGEEPRLGVCATDRQSWVRLTDLTSGAPGRGLQLSAGGAPLCNVGGDGHRRAVRPPRVASGELGPGHPCGGWHGRHCHSPAPAWLGFLFSGGDWSQCWGPRPCMVGVKSWRRCPALTCTYLVTLQAAQHLQASAFLLQTGDPNCTHL